MEVVSRKPEAGGRWPVAGSKKVYRGIKIKCIENLAPEENYQME